MSMKSKGWKTVKPGRLDIVKPTVASVAETVERQEDEKCCLCCGCNTWKHLEALSIHFLKEWVYDRGVYLFPSNDSIQILIHGS